ncbi:MAG: pyridoxamine 5'-phosphate oxidase family protein, partial [Thermomicrobiales bacterium]|nr:pyridoxamine 5'-phosphate oxidase family protein [Thermomicrobiales bacterium]
CCAHGAGEDARPYLVPLAFGYDGAALYAHSGPGRKLRIMRANPLVSVEVDHADAPDRWRSVVAEGVFEELSDPAARQHALRSIYRAPTPIPALGPETTVFRIRLTAKSGRYEIPD